LIDRSSLTYHLVLFAVCPMAEEVLTTNAQVTRLGGVAGLLAWAGRSLELVDEAVSHGNHPFGALLVYPSDEAADPPFLLEAENTVITERDATRHAELNLVSLACRELTPSQRAAAVLVTSTEPCAMCSGAIYWAGIKTIVYVCPAPRLAVYAGATLQCHSATVFAGAVAAPACWSLHELLPSHPHAQLFLAQAEAQHEAYWKGTAGAEHES
jgi:tRNA(Arg) A34 adenosine deaminase TadA